MIKKTHEQYIKDITNINPCIEVVGKYVNSKTKILHRCKICGYEWLAKPNAVLSRNSNCPECNKTHKTKLQRKSHEKYIEELAIKNPTIEVIERYVDAKTKIAHRCKNCGHTWKPAPYNVLNNGNGCPVCAHKVIGDAPEYKNSIWASEHRNYFSKYMTEEQMKMYMPNSMQKIELSCPSCNHKKHIAIVDLLHCGFGCLYCSDGVSYPNKFARAFVEQLPVYDIDNEYSPDWCIINNNKCRYDIYFKYNNQEYIIEMDGGIGHGNKKFNSANDLEGALKDKEKDRLAQEHGINLIRIDSKESNREYIKKSILISRLYELFDLTNIDWDYCDRQATKSNVFETSALWNKGLSIKAISEKLHVHRKTIRDYLMRANKLGLCDYSKQESYKRGYVEVSKSNSGRIKSKETRKKISDSKKQKNLEINPQNTRKVIRLFDKTIYDCLGKASNENGVHRGTMTKYCKQHKGFMYYDEWLVL